MTLIVIRKRIVPQEGNRFERHRDVLCFDKVRGQYWMGFDACELLDFAPARTFGTTTGALLAQAVMGGTETQPLLGSVDQRTVLAA